MMTQQRTLKAPPAATSSSSSNSRAQTNKVFLGNLPFTITDDFIKNLVESNLGKNLVTHVNIIRGSKTKRPMGILFIDFVNPAAAERAVAFFDGYDLDGRILNSNLKYPEEIGEAKKQKEKEKEKEKLPPLRIPNTIYLSNLDYSLCEEELFNMCDDLVGVGLVKDVRIPLDKNTGSPRGFAYIEFHDPSSIELAINELTNVEVYGRLLRADKMTAPPKKVKEEDAV
jgi:nucleolin